MEKKKKFYQRGSFWMKILEIGVVAGSAAAAIHYKEKADILKGENISLRKENKCLRKSVEISTFNLGKTVERLQSIEEKLTSKNGKNW